MVFALEAQKSVSPEKSDILSPTTKRMYKCETNQKKGQI